LLVGAALGILGGILALIETFVIETYETEAENDRILLKK